MRPALFGYVKRDVGLIHQIACVLARFGDGNADGDADLNLGVADFDRLADERDRLLSCDQRKRDRVLRRQDQEFVAAQSRNHGCSKLFAQTIGDGDEHLVTRRMAKQIIGTLEAVEIERKHDLNIAGFGAGSVFVEIAPVRKPGQRIVTRNPAGVVFGGSPATHFASEIGQPSCCENEPG